MGEIAQGRLDGRGEPMSLLSPREGTLLSQRGKQGTPTWPKDVFKCELYPGRKSGHRVLQTVIQEEGIQGETFGVIDSCH